jgi:CRP/FNR family transcriptional regulator/CRP/FNR family cyclic AMP-dependent transcriptional regulator
MERTPGGGIAPNSRAALLASNPLFGNLSPEDLEGLARSARSQHFDRGHFIYRREDPGQALYVIIKGAVKICVSSEEGHESILGILTDGQFFGELAIFEEERRSVDAEAMEPTEVLCIARDNVIDLLERQPRHALGQLLKVVGQRLIATDEMLHDNAYLDIPGRVAKRLVELADEHGLKTPEGMRINVRLTHQDLANMIGASRENVSRALAQFKDSGWATKSKGYFVVQNAAKLRERSGHPAH